MAKTKLARISQASMTIIQKNRKPWETTSNALDRLLSNITQKEIDYERIRSIIQEEIENAKH